MSKGEAEPTRSFADDLTPETAFMLAVVGGGILLFVLPVLWIYPTQRVLTDTGFYLWFYGDDFADTAINRTRQNLWVTAIATPLHVLTTLLIVRFLLGIPLSRIGLTPRHLGRNLLAGLVLAVIFLPGSLGLNLLATQVLRSAGSEPQEHPFAKLGTGELFPIEWGLLIFVAVVVAPVWEELFFRGLVQNWVMGHPGRGGLAVLGVSALMAISAVGSDVAGLSMTAMMLKLAPVWVLIPFVMIFVVLAGKRLDWAGLWAVAVLFGWIHVHAWPTPVPLVWLGVGLGWLAWRGQSLAGPMMLHAVFNAFACLVLLLGGG